MTKRLTVYCDGLYEPRFRPDGWSCWGWVAIDNFGKRIAQDGGCLGRGREKFSNNVAEYVAVGKAIRYIRDNNLEADVFTDSKLVVEQVAGRWACNAEHLIPYRDRIRYLLKGMQNVTLSWVPRASNAVADEYVNEVYRQATEAA